MYSPKTIPPFIRYFKARLIPLKNPMFWGSIGILVLVSLCLFQYWRNPTLLTLALNETEIAGNYTEEFNDSFSEVPVSDDELVLGADLDNIELLLSELRNTQLLNSAPLSSKKKSKRKPQSSQQQGLLDQILSQRQANPETSSNQFNNNLLGLTTTEIPKVRTYNSSPTTNNNRRSRSSYSRYNSSNLRHNNSNLVPTQAHPLQEAVNRLYTVNSETKNTPTQSSNTTNRTNSTPANNNILSGQINNSTTFLGRVNSNNNSTTGITLQPNPYNYLNQTQPVNRTPNYFGQVTPQGFNQINRTTATDNSRFTSNLTSPGIQPTQIQQNRLNRPNFNNTRLQPLPSQQNQFNQPNLNNSGLQTGQFNQNQFNQNQFNQNPSNFNN